MKRNAHKREEHRILEGEAEKLKVKLEHLKEQIQAKKKEKEISKQIAKGQNLESSRKSNISQKSNRSNQEPDEQFLKLITDLKLEAFVHKLSSKGITTKQQFDNLNEEDMQTWKDIAIGYRIKIKNYLSKLRNPNLSSSKKRFILVSPQKLQYEAKHIEDIVKQRKEEQVFVPLQRQREEKDQLEENIGEEEQEVMIQSLMKAFRVAPSKQSEEVEAQLQDQEEQDSIEEIKYQKPIASVKVIKQVYESDWPNQFPPEYKYCWVCLSMLKGQSELILNNRQFCSQSCLNKYRQTWQIPQSSAFYSQISQVEEKFQNYLKTRENKKQPEAVEVEAEVPRKRIIRRQPLKEQREEFNIEVMALKQELKGKKNQEELDLEIV